MDFDNSYILFLVLGLCIISYLVYIYYYKPNKEPFILPFLTNIPIFNTEVVEIPMPPRNVSPSGPSPPNVKPSCDTQTDIYTPIPDDPLDEKYGSQDIKDNVRNPDRLFGPGEVQTDGMIETNSIQPYSGNEEVWESV